MQETRQHILEILRETGQATVDDIVIRLRERRDKNITAVTVRHHLNELQTMRLITPPQRRRKDTPGRPQHVYSLTEKAQEHFPDNYQALASNLISQIKSKLPPESINVIVEGIADDMANNAHIGNLPIDRRLEKIVQYLDDNGYKAGWERVNNGFVLYTTNCPYHQISHTTDALCQMDMRLVSSLLGVVPRLLSRVSEGDSRCAYFIPDLSS
jgi:predicted ArsR family transcriptional regulator